MIGIWLAALVALSPAAEPEGVAIRVLPEVLTAEGSSVPPGLLDRLLGAFETAVVEGWPTLVAQGRAREAGPVRADAEAVVHLGLRLVRYQERQVTLPGAKSSTTVRATLAPFAVDLGTGEVLASRPQTWIVSGSVAGTDTVYDPATLRDMLVDQGVADATARLREGFVPGRLTAEVVRRTPDGAWVARGAQDGAYVGERYRTPGGGRAEVVELAPRVSRVRVQAPTAPLEVGAWLERFGAAPKAGVPRVLVVPAVSMPEGSTSGDQVAMWVEDALAENGWVVVPGGTALIGAQLAESARIDVPRERLVNAQSVPDMVAVPTVWHLATTHDIDPTGAAMIQASAGVQVDVYDARQGTLVTSFVAQHQQDVPTRAALVDSFSQDLRVTAIKDALRGLWHDDAAAPPPAGPTATVLQGSAEGVRWDLRDAPLPVGVLGEVHHVEETLTHPRTGEALGGPLRLVGVARVAEHRRDQVRAAWVTKAGPVRAGDLFVPGSARVGTEPLEVVVAGIAIGDRPAEGLDAVVAAGFRSGEGVRVVADGVARGALTQVEGLVRGGGFAGAIERSSVAPRLRATLTFEVDQARTDKGAKVGAVVSVASTVTVTDLSTGEPVLLKAPSASSAVPTYAMRTVTTLEGREGKGDRIVGLSDEAIAHTIRTTLHQAARTLGTRTAIMVHTARSP